LLQKQRNEWENKVVETHIGASGRNFHTDSFSLLLPSQKKKKILAMSSLNNAQHLDRRSASLNESGVFFFFYYNLTMD